VTPAPPYPLLVDPRTGLVRRLFRPPTPPEFPAAYIAVGAEVADTGRIGRWQADRLAYGTAFHDEQSAAAAALGEAVERYCGNLVPDRLLRASYSELVAEGRSAVRPADLMLYSASQYEARGFPFVRFTADLSVRWVPGVDLLTDAAVLAPASLAYINFYRGPYQDEPPTNFVPYAGVAAGPTRAAAERSALEELIERDAVTTWWHSGAPAVKLDPAADPALAADLWAREPDAGIAYHFIVIPSLIQVPVIGVLIEDQRRGIVALGTACRATPLAAARKALAEAIYLHGFSRELLDPGSGVWRAVEAGVFDRRFYRPFRADRAYLDDFRTDYHDVIDLATHAQLYLDPRMHTHLRRILDVESAGTVSAVPAVDAQDARAEYLGRLSLHGIRAVSIDVTSADVRSAGLTVVRVIAPGLYGNAPAAFPYLGGHRLYERRSPDGSVTPLREDELVLVPIPHT
jgi:ribosomal protein S12 methylthiotransferase accessory factor